MGEKRSSGTINIQYYCSPFLRSLRSPLDFKILYHGNRINTLWKFNVERFNEPPCIEGSGAVPPAPPDYEMFEKKLGKASRNLMAGLGHHDEADIREF